MSAKQTSIIFSTIALIIGLILGFLISRYLLPRLGILENDLKDENVYQVEHNECPVEEEPPQCSIFVDINGALKNPGVYCFNPGDRVIDAVKKAGGFSKNISMEYVARSINLSNTLIDNQKIYFPSKQELLCELKDFTLKEAEVVPTQTTEDTNTTDDSTNDCVNINTADITTLDSLQGIGLSTAQKIIDNRPYSSLTDLLNVSGIGQATYDKFKDNICL